MIRLDCRRGGGPRWAVNPLEGATMSIFSIAIMIAVALFNTALFSFLVLYLRKEAGYGGAAST